MKLSDLLKQRERLKTEAEKLVKNNLWKLALKRAS